MILLESLAAAVAKFASASTVVQVATGLGITVAGVTGAGAAGVLPGAVQDGFAGAVETVTPFDVPGSDDAAAETEDSHHDGADDDPVSPTTIPAPPTTTVPTAPVPTTTVPTTTVPSSPEATEHPEVEPGDDDGIHQHRGGREETVPAVRTDNSGPGSVNSGRDHAEDDDAAPSTVDTPEVEDHGDEDGDDGGHHGGDHGGDDPEGDSSGHGSGDDD